MKNLSQELNDYLQQEALTLCWCWRATLIDGSVLLYTDHDSEIILGDELFSPNNGINVSILEAKSDLSTNNMSVEGRIDFQSLSDQDILEGRLNNANIDILLVNWQQPELNYLIHKGNIGEIIQQDGQFTAELVGVSRDLERISGRTLNPLCDATLGDGRCKINLDDASYSSNVEVIKVSGLNQVEIRYLDTNEALQNQPAVFNHGSIEFTELVTDADTRARSKTIAIYDDMQIKDGRSISLWSNVPHWVSSNTPAKLIVGCDKSFATCKDSFANVSNFRGFPHLPGSRVAYAFPAQKRKSQDGDSLAN